MGKMTGNEAIIRLAKPLNNNPRTFFEALDVAKSSIKHQSPDKVLYTADGYADGNLVYDMAQCPNCGHEFEESDDNWEQPFCMYCGKALDWEVENLDD